jgi:hypothetical protein
MGGPRDGLAKVAAATYSDSRKFFLMAGKGTMHRARQEIIFENRYNNSVFLANWPAGFQVPGSGF